MISTSYSMSCPARTSRLVSALLSAPTYRPRASSPLRPSCSSSVVPRCLHLRRSVSQSMACITVDVDSDTPLLWVLRATQ